MELSRISRYADKLFDSNHFKFKFHKGGKATILSTSFGVQLNYLIHALEAYPANSISEKLIAQQNAQTGLFIDENFDVNQLTGYTEEYLLWQFTYFATIALDMLGAAPCYPFSFLADLKDGAALERWLKKQDYQNIWRTSNTLMFLLFFLTYERERQGANTSHLIHCILEFLDATQDPRTGFWGTDCGASLEYGMYGAAHFFLYYDYHGRRIGHQEQIIDNVIKLQNSNGSFGLGGSCPDYDAIEILSILMKHLDYEEELVKERARQACKTIKWGQKIDGGFPERMGSRTPLERLMLRRPGCFTYSGWDLMQCDNLSSNIWATYFRSLAIAKIETMLAGRETNQYIFYDLPAWGYY